MYEGRLNWSDVMEEKLSILSDMCFLQRLI